MASTFTFLPAAATWPARPLVGPGQVVSYLPQQPPFTFIDTLYACEPDQAWAGLWVQPSQLLVEQGYLSEAGILESMAQAVALKSGYEGRQQTGETEPQVGFIAALRHLSIERLPPVWSTLLTQVQVRLRAPGVLVVHTSSSVEGRPVAHCEMRLFLEPAQPSAQPAAAAAPASAAMSDNSCLLSQPLFPSPSHASSCRPAVGLVLHA